MVKTGDFLLLVQGQDDKPALTTVRVERVDPLTLSCPSNPATDLLTVGSRITLIMRGDVPESHAIATVRSITRFGKSHVIELDQAKWVQFDRRRAPRYQVDLSGELTIVKEEEGEPGFMRVPAHIVDLSDVGCRLECDAPLERGSLVALRIVDPDGKEDYKFLAIVTRTNSKPSWAGLEFFDYSGNTRFRLSRYLSTLSGAA
ncbi:MAG: PilZ domain-containing protein [Candidatus Caldarchaeum sp.]